METSQGSQRRGGPATIDSQGSRPQLQGKPRKNSKLGSVLRKLLGRKSIKSQISLPTPATISDDSPFGKDPAFIKRDQRAVSLPARHITRESALGSNAPCVETVKEEEEGELNKGSWYYQRPYRPRRASMPAATSPLPDLGSAPKLPTKELKTSPPDESNNIGYAVTSGSHPNRRSKSADALHDLTKDELIVETNPDDKDRRRSDEIRTLRNSLAIGPSIYGDLIQPEPREFRLQPPQSAFSVSEDDESQILHHEEEAIPMSAGGDRYRSYDFNAIATQINEQESIPVEDRLMIIEIKLMDLENALAKARSSSPSANTSTPRPGDVTKPAGSLPPETPDKKDSKPSPTFTKSEPRTASTASAVSTQPTDSSLSNNYADGEDSDPFVDSKNRPTSTGTAFHQPTSAATESPNPVQTRPHRPVSLTSITIDHYTTLISLIRREQHARIRLENQVADLQRELFHFMHPQQAQPSSPLSASNSMGSLYRSRRWDGSRRDVVKIDDFHISKRSRSYERVARQSGDDEDDGAGTIASTDDGYNDVFETPTEQNRAEFEGRHW